jgi:hypothetical protein
MKILILVQGANVDMYPAMRKAQQETWDSVEVPGVDTLYYSGDINSQAGCYLIHPWSTDLYTSSSDVLNMSHWKMKLALLAFAPYNMGKYDMIFRTNASSYCDKAMILEKALTLPKKKCYCGIDGGGYASGCGVFISPDCMKLILEGIDEEPNAAEDALMGGILGKHGIGVTPGAERQDFGSVNDAVRNVYHYRCVIDKSDRTKDIQIFNRIHDTKRRA